MDLTSLNDLHTFLVDELHLLSEDMSKGSWRNYYHLRIDRHPSSSTRVIKVIFDENLVVAIQLCASSDNNHAVMLQLAVDCEGLSVRLSEEIKIVEQRLSCRP
jgi:hypothetical protein